MFSYLNVDAFRKKRYRIFSTEIFYHTSLSLMSEYEHLLKVEKPICKKQLIDCRVF